MGLPGVKVGPLDPDRTADFGQVSGRTSARSLIRLHTQAHPKPLMEALIRKLDPERTKALDLTEVRDFLAGEELENGDPVVPEGAEVVGCAVRGERDQPQVLTFVYALKSGRTGKWFAEYSSDTLPDSFEAGTENVRIADMKEKGVVSYEHNAGEGADRVGKDDREKRRLERQVAELESRLAAAEAPAAAAAKDEDDAEPPAAQEAPVEGYDEMNASEAIKLLKAEGTSDEERQAILDYEKTHANRKGVVGAAEVSLGARGDAE